MSVTISQTLLTPPLQVSVSDDIRLRAWYTNNFVAGDGVTSVQGGDGQTGFYYDILCSLNDDGNVIIPAFDVQETMLSNPTAGFFGWLYVNGSRTQSVFGYPQATAGWQIPTIYGDVVSFDQLARYNAAVQILFASNAFFTQNQTIAEIERIAGNFAYAAVGVNGIGQPSVAPDVPGAPIFLGVNDPRVNVDLTENSVPRAGPDNSLRNGLPVDDGTNWNIQTLGQVGLGDLDPDTSGGKGSFISVNDSITEEGGRASIQAGGADQIEYAGVSADCSSGNGEINVQSTGITNLYGVNQVTIIGDGKNEQQGTQMVVNDPLRMVAQTVANQVPNDPSLSSEQACFYLDEADSKLKVRVRLSDGSYLNGEIALI